MHTNMNDQKTIGIRNSICILFVRIIIIIYMYLEINIFMHISVFYLYIYMYVYIFLNRNIFDATVLSALQENQNDKFTKKIIYI
jgi:hypothetical protein